MRTYSTITQIVRKTITLPSERKIFIVNEGEFTDEDEKDTRQNRYEEIYGYIINVLNDPKFQFQVLFQDLIESPEYKGYEKDIEEFKDQKPLPLFDKLWPLLSRVWRKHENDLRVNEYYVEGNEGNVERFDRDKDNNIWGVYINIDDNIQYTDWLPGYHYIFHEFFHNIDYAAGPTIKGKKDFISYNYNDNIFGKTIIEEINILLKEENNEYKKILDNLPRTYKAALYDIIGAVYYFDKYPETGDQDQFGHEISYWLRDFLCDKDAKGKDTPKSEEDIKLVFNSLADFADNMEYKVSLEEREKGLNDIKYIELIFNKDKKNTEKAKKAKEAFRSIALKAFKNNPMGFMCFNSGFHKRLANEAFANMAAAAITHPIAYKHIQKCLPESEKIFREILNNIEAAEPEESTACREFWIQTG